MTMKLKLGSFLILVRLLVGQIERMTKMPESALATFASFLNTREAMQLTRSSPQLAKLGVSCLLTHLDLSYNKRVRLDLFPASFPLLESLDLSNARLVGGSAGLTPQRFPRLRTLRLQAVSVLTPPYSVTDFEFLKGFSSLEELDLTLTTFADLSLLPRSLKRLRVGPPHRITHFHSISGLGAFPRLESLVWNWNWNYVSFYELSEELRGNTSLRHIELGAAGTLQTLDGLGALATQLQTFSLNRALNFVSLAGIRKMSALRELSLIQCGGPELVGFDEFSQLSDHLEKLTIRETFVTNAGFLNELKNVRHLEVRSVERGGIVDPDIAVIDLSNSPSLKEVTIQSYMQGAALSKISVKASPLLERLIISPARVSTAGQSILMKPLLTVDLSGCSSLKEVFVTVARDILGLETLAQLRHLTASATSLNLDALPVSLQRLQFTQWNMDISIKPILRLHKLTFLSFPLFTDHEAWLHLKQMGITVTIL